MSVSRLQTESPDILQVDDLAAYCEANGLNARVHRLSVPTLTVPDAAAAVGTEPERIAKSLVFLVNGEPLLVVAAGEGRIRCPLLAAALGVSRKRVRFATAEEALRITGYPVGAMPPFGHRQALPTLVDELTVPSSGRVYAGGGSVSALLEVDVAELLAVSGGKWVPLTESS